MRFKNESEMVKYFQKQLDNGNTEAFKSSKNNMNGIPVVSKTELQEAAVILKEYLYKRIKDYFDSYDPSVYERTGKFLDSLEVEPIQVDGVQSYRVFFDNSKVIRDSMFGGSPGFLPDLLDSGWTVGENVSFRNIPHLGFFEGAGFISNAIADAENDERFKGINITFNAGSPF